MEASAWSKPGGIESTTLLGGEGITHALCHLQLRWCHSGRSLNEADACAVGRTGALKGLKAGQ